MKVLYHIPGGVIGGAESQVAYLVNNLPDHIVPLVTYESPHMEKFIFNTIKTKSVHRIQSKNDFAKKLLLFRPDIIQFYHSPHFYRYLSTVPYRAKVVEVAHNMSYFGWDSTTYPKDLTDALVCVSPDAEAYYVSKRGRDVRTVIIPNGVDTDRFYPSSEAKEKTLRPVIGYCGRLEDGDGKGIESLIKVASSLPVDLELVGYDFGNYKRKLRDRINFRVYPHTTNIADYYRRWDVFVSCSPKEGFGLAIAEALACGVPCVILECGGICHYLNKYGAQAYIAKDLEDVKKGIEDVLNSRVVLNPTSIDFSAKTMAKKYEVLYNELLTTPKIEYAEEEVIVPHEVTKNFTLGVVPASWMGIRHALEGTTDAFCEPNETLKKVLTLKPSTLVFGGFSPTWMTILKSVRRFVPTIHISYHGTAAISAFSEEIREGLILAITAAKSGLADLIITPHEGMARTLNNLSKVNAIYVPNKITPIEVPKVDKLKGLNIGLFGTGLSWKNIDAQILAAAITPDLTMLHVQNVDMKLLEALGIAYKVHPYHYDRKKFYEIAASMTINLAVSFTEAFGYFPLESYLLGVPAIVGETTPSFRNAEGALKKCIVKYIDDPAAISDAISEVLADYDNVLEEGKKLCRRLIRES